MANPTPAPKEIKLSTYVQVGQILCPVNQEVIIRYKAVEDDDDDDDDDQIPSFYMSHFKESRIIGYGGFALVAECRNRFDQRTYAIKKIVIGHKPKSSEESNQSYEPDEHDESDQSEEPDQATSYHNLKREVEIWSSLDHKNIVRYYESWVEPRFAGRTVADWPWKRIDLTKPCLYIQLECCESSLKSKLRPCIDWKDKWMTKAECAQTFADIVNGLYHLETERVMHGDISDANILFDRDGVAKITDFGLARRIGDAEEDDGANNDMVYRAPERKKDYGSRKPDTKSDIYSLGILLFEMMQPVSTSMGRSKYLKALAQQNTFPAHWDSLPAKKWVERMINETAEDRPSASYLLDNITTVWEDIVNSEIVSAA